MLQHLPPLPSHVPYMKMLITLFNRSSDTQPTSLSRTTKTITSLSAVLPPCLPHIRNRSPISNRFLALALSLVFVVTLLRRRDTSRGYMLLLMRQLRPLHPSHEPLGDDHTCTSTLILLSRRVSAFSFSISRDLKDTRWRQYQARFYVHIRISRGNLQTRPGPLFSCSRPEAQTRTRLPDGRTAPASLCVLILHIDPASGVDIGINREHTRPSNGSFCFRPRGCRVSPLFRFRDMSSIAILVSDLPCTRTSGAFVGGVRLFKVCSSLPFFILFSSCHPTPCPPPVSVLSRRVVGSCCARAVPSGNNVWLASPFHWHVLHMKC